MIFRAFGDVRIDLAYVGAAQIGEILYVHWAFPFMALGFMLTVALIGAIVLARQEEGEGPAPERSEEGAHPGLGSSGDVTAEPGPAVGGGSTLEGAQQ